MWVEKDRYELQKAASEGDCEYLKKAANEKRDVEPEFFLGVLREESAVAGNILHLAVYFRKIGFIRVAVDVLPKDILQDLLCDHSSTIASSYFDGRTPLHTALEMEDLEATKLFLSVYDHVGTTLSPARKPWLMRTFEGIRPFDLALQGKYEKCLVHMLSLDMDLLCNIDILSGKPPELNKNNDECSLLFFAIAYGMNQLASKILNAKTTTYSLIGTYNATPLHIVSNSSESVCRLLLKKHPELISKVNRNGYSILHQWAESGEVWPLKLFLTDEILAAASKDLILSVTKQEKQNPVHVAVKCKKPDFVKRLLEINQQLFAITQQSSLDILRMKDIDGDTPLHLAMIPGMEDTALSFIDLDHGLCHVRNKKGESPLLLAVKNDCADAVKRILGFQDIDFKMLRRNDGMTVIHALSNCGDKAVAALLIKKFWWLIDLKDDAGKTALDYAKNNDASWAVDMLNEHSHIQKEEFDWKAACQRKESLSVRGFVGSCPNLEDVCRNAQDTPLHHLKLRTYKEYKDFLQIPNLMGLKNMRDSEGATPLHRALREDNTYLAKALLTDDAVERTLKDYIARETAMDILSKLYKKDDDEWREMCRSIKVNPLLRNLGSSAVEMRNTLSVVAALLAALTFTVGFTLPGGLDSETGQASLAKKGSFIVFILADTYAMTCSMLVLFCMVWSMVGELDTSQVLIDRGMPILIQSFCGTLLAFMTGIFSVMSRQCMWAAAVIIGVCSFVTIIAISRRILYQVTDIVHRFFDKLYRKLHKMYKSLRRDERREQSRRLEERRALNP